MLRPHRKRDPQHTKTNKKNKDMKNPLKTIFKIRVQLAVNMKTFKDERREFYILCGRQIHKRVIPQQ